MSEYYYTLEQLLKAAQKLTGIVVKQTEGKNIYINNALNNLNYALNNLGYSSQQQARLDYELIIYYLSNGFKYEPSDDEHLGNYPRN